MSIGPKNLPDGKLSMLERIAYGSGNFGNAFIYTIIGAYLVFYYTDVIGLSAGTIGLIMLISRLFDGVTDLIMGRIVDNTKSNKGKGRVWILRICIPYALASVIMFMVPQNASDTLKYIFVFISYNFVNAILYTAIVVPYNTLGCLITENSFERGALGIAAMFGSCLASIVVNSTILQLVQAMGGDAAAWTKAIAVYAVLGVVTHLFCYKFTKERITENEGPEQSETKVPISVGIKSLVRNRYWVIFVFANLFLWMMVTIGMGSTVYYTKNVLQNENLAGMLMNISSILQVVFLFVSAVLIGKIGKGRTLLVGGLFMLASPISVIFAPTSTVCVIASAALKGIGSGIASACALGVTADTIDYSDWKFGVRATGLGTSAISFSQKVASGLGGVIMGFILDIGKYDGLATVQLPSALAAIKTCFIYVPLVLMIAFCVMLFFYDLDKQLDTIHADLDARRNSNN